MLAASAVETRRKLLPSQKKVPDTGRNGRENRLCTARLFDGRTEPGEGRRRPKCENLSDGDYYYYNSAAAARSAGIRAGGAKNLRFKLAVLGAPALMIKHAAAAAAAEEKPHTVRPRLPLRAQSIIVAYIDPVVVRLPRGRHGN